MTDQQLPKHGLSQQQREEQIDQLIRRRFAACKTGDLFANVWSHPDWGFQLPHTGIQRTLFDAVSECEGLGAERLIRT